VISQHDDTLRKKLREQLEELLLANAAEDLLHPEQAVSLCGSSILSRHIATCSLMTPVEGSKTLIGDRISTILISPSRANRWTNAVFVVEDRNKSVPIA